MAKIFKRILYRRNETNQSGASIEALVANSNAIGTTALLFDRRTKHSKGILGRKKADCVKAIDCMS